MTTPASSLKPQALPAGRVQRGRIGWIVVGLSCGAMGRYRTRAEADEARRRVLRTLQELEKEAHADAKKKRLEA